MTLSSNLIIAFVLMVGQKFLERVVQETLTKENQLIETLILHETDPAFREGVEVGGLGRELEGQYGGRREKAGLGTNNKEEASRRAARFYKNLVSKGWDSAWAALAPDRKAKLLNPVVYAASSAFAVRVPHFLQQLRRGQIRNRANQPVPGKRMRALELSIEKAAEIINHFSAGHLARVFQHQDGVDGSITDVFAGLVILNQCV